ncbi:MAG: hypothetical protein Q9174_002122 [Haloplaca sp. 1 TL-2023]
MSSPGGLTPLEMLILLQQIQRLDSRPISFEALAESVKSSKLSSRNGSSSPERLEPRLLESLYLKLLKEEVKSEISKNRTPSPVQNVNPRKRKLSSPRLDTLEEASHYKHLIPQVAVRVYNDYRESVLREVDDQERNYRAIQKDIQEIEHGDWDTRFQPNKPAARRDSKSISSIQTLLHDEPEVTKDSNGLSAPPLPPPLQAQAANQTRSASTVPVEQSIPSGNGTAGTAASSNAAAESRESTIAAQPPEHASYDKPPSAPRLPSQPRSADGSMPFPPPQQHGQQVYQRGSPPHDIHRRQSSQPANIAPSPRSRPQQSQLPSRDHTSGSPIILPPPAGMLRATSSPSRPLDTLNEMAGPHTYRPNVGASPHSSQSSHAFQHPAQLPPPSNYVPRPYQYPSYDNRPPYQHSYGTYHAGPSPPYQAHNHAQASPYPHPSSGHGQSPYYTPRPTQSPMQSYPQYSHYSSASPYTLQGPTTSPYAPYPPPQSLGQRTPVQTSASSRRLPKPSPINTSVSSTKWKKFDTVGEVKSPKSPIQPRSAEISPISETAPSPIFSPADPVSSGKQMPSLSKRGKPGRPRGSKNKTLSTRGASIASSAHQQGTRSASVASGADELSLEAPTSAANRISIKPEPPATPARESSASLPPTSALDPEGNRKSTRRRRETIRGIEMSAETTRTYSKRKRADTMDTLDPDARPSPFVSELDRQKSELSATHILASTNFPKTCNPLMNDLTAHKLASIFAKPLTEREAPGYPSLVYRPQDLKSIKQAIANGNKALHAFIEQDGDDEKGDNIIAVAGAGGNDARIWVKKNEDLLPPKGIVNSAQLEKEVMRVFANAVMFNPDPGRGLGPAYSTRARIKERHVPLDISGEVDEDEEEEGKEEEGGVVKDAREMFEDAEEFVSKWRAAEKAGEAAPAAAYGKAIKAKEVEEEDADELAGDESAMTVDEGAGEQAAGESRPGKRRRR